MTGHDSRADGPAIWETLPTLVLMILLPFLVFVGALGDSARSASLWTVAALIWLSALLTWARSRVASGVIAVLATGGLVAMYLGDPERFGTTVAVVAFTGGAVCLLGVLVVSRRNAREEA